MKPLKNGSAVIMKLCIHLSMLTSAKKACRLKMSAGTAAVVDIEALFRMENGAGSTMTPPSGLKKRHMKSLTVCRVPG
jgi:hypothetical protein